MTRKTVVTFGDSLTAGFRCNGDDSKFMPYSAELKRRMAASKRLPKSWRAADIVSAGCPGESAAHAVHCGRLQGVLQRVRSPRDTLVVILAGTNDLRSYPPPPPVDVAGSLCTLRDVALTAGARVMLLTVPPMPSSEARNPSLRARRLDLNRLIMSLAVARPGSSGDASAGASGTSCGGGSDGATGRGLDGISEVHSSRVHSADMCRWLDGECGDQWDSDGLHLSKAAYKQLGGFVHDELVTWLVPASRQTRCGS